MHKGSRTKVSSSSICRGHTSPPAGRSCPVSLPVNFSTAKKCQQRLNSGLRSARARSKEATLPLSGYQGGLPAPLTLTCLLQVQARPVEGTVALSCPVDRTVPCAQVRTKTAVDGSGAQHAFS